MDSLNESQQLYQINKDQIWIDTIKKELKYQKLHTEYTQNPFSQG